jgi:hypothetical protein
MATEWRLSQATKPDFLPGSFLATDETRMKHGSIQETEDSIRLQTVT